jgi:hypothetical protein
MIQRVEGTLSEDEAKAAALSIFELADANRDQKLTFSEWYQAVLRKDAEQSGLVELHSSEVQPVRPGFHNLDVAQLFRDADHAERLNDALSKVFILIFLLYPGMTNKIFDGLICRDLGGDPAITVLEVDYTIDCAETSALRWTMGAILIAVWPIGVPAVLLWRMYRVKDKILAEDTNTLKQFHFVLGDYKTEYWYWEVVELGRKLILSGLIGLFGRGSIAQCFSATIISFLFFASAIRAQPFKLSTNNFYKAFAEVQIFGVLMVCIVLQTNKTGLPLSGITEDVYGHLQLALTVSAGPLIAWIVFLRLSELRGHLKEVSETKVASAVDNPTFKGHNSDGDEET